LATDLFEAQYVPTIFLRRAELKAVEELPEATKDTLTPIFCLKPWLSSKDLRKSVKKIETVFGDDRRYFLDIDPFYEAPADNLRLAQEEFLELIDEDSGTENWIDLLAEYPNACPCLQVERAAPEQVQMQISAFTEMDRTFLVRLNYSGRDWRNIVQAVCETEHTNFGFVIDLEWSRDLLSRIEWGDRLIKQIVQLRGDSIPICVNGSSFPNSFTEYSDGGHAELFERTAFDSLSRNNGQARLIYGDWASSRPPGESIPIKHEIPPRIDLPTESSWEFFRVSSDEGGFQEAARQSLNSENYPYGIDIWGTYLIASTAQGGTGAENDQSIISHREKAAAARINIHLYRQLNFGSRQINPDTDDDFIE